MPEVEVWAPGSFTKNFSWGPRSQGLLELHEAIRVGFDNRVKDVLRSAFRSRLAQHRYIDFIPMNFFLYNKIINGQDFIIADELVFQAVNFPHSEAFDRLALCSFLLSFAGKWKGSNTNQRRPALWANSYVRNRLSKDFDWNFGKVSADDIEKFVANSANYTGKTARKLATNLYYLLVQGRINEFNTSGVLRWWVDALFLALDRIQEDRALDGSRTEPAQLPALLSYYNFLELTGAKTLERELAVPHLIQLYLACGGRERFDPEYVALKTRQDLAGVSYTVPNDELPRGALDPTNPRMLKSIPWICAMLAKYLARFEILSPDELENFNIIEYVQLKTIEALKLLDQENVRPNLTASQLRRITRDDNDA